MDRKQKQVVVVGGGAAGFFCAVNVARLNPNMLVTLVEKSDKLLSKVKVSGGGRCNVTHACFDIVEMSKNYPRGSQFVKKSFHQFFTTDTIAWFEKRGVQIKKEADGRMFPITDQSQTIINTLLLEASKYKVKISMKTGITGIEKNQDQFYLHTDKNEILAADFICLACGGFSTAAKFDWIVKLGHSIATPVPSLFTFNMPKHPICKLMGVAVNRVQVKLLGTKLEQVGPLLITHWGMSGPAILKLSAWGARLLAEKNYQFKISVNWVPENREQGIVQIFQSLRMEHPTQKVVNGNTIGLPKRLWEYFLTEAGIDFEIRWTNLQSKALHKLAKLLCSSEFEIKGKTTFKEEFVTAGGIALAEIDHNTMMSKKIENLFFAGEIMDVDGVTGGFNFQHAWTSGYIAASAIAKSF